MLYATCSLMTAKLTLHCCWYCEAGLYVTQLTHSYLPKQCLLAPEILTASLPYCGASHRATPLPTIAVSWTVLIMSMEALTLLMPKKDRQSNIIHHVQLERHLNDSINKRWKRLLKNNKEEEEKAKASGTDFVPQEQRPEAAFVASLVDEFVEV